MVCASAASASARGCSGPPRRADWWEQQWTAKGPSKCLRVGQHKAGAQGWQVRGGEGARAICTPAQIYPLSPAGPLPVTDTPVPRTAVRSCLRGFEPGASSAGIRCMTAELRNLSTGLQGYGRTGHGRAWQRGD